MKVYDGQTVVSIKEYVLFSGTKDTDYCELVLNPFNEVDTFTFISIHLRKNGTFTTIDNRAQFEGIIHHAKNFVAKFFAKL